MEFISSPFGYLRHLRPKLLVGIRKQTNEKKQLEKLAPRTIKQPFFSLAAKL